MSLFSFDEESFSNGVQHITINNSASDPLAEQEDYEPQEYFKEESNNGVTSGTLPILIHRRKSSAYHRLSISHSYAKTNELLIPKDYDNSVHQSNRKLSDFKPLRVLGQGAYGKVYLVQDQITGKLFAQKQLRKPAISIISEPHNESDSSKAHLNHVTRTISEREILTNITHHNNIVKLFYALQDHDKFYLILEYIPGGELFHHLTSSKNALGNVFKEDHVAFYAAQMALAIKHLHELGIVYRDLKPENCLLNSSGHLVLTDFGLSKNLDDDENKECTSIIGTPEYMAPEVLKGEQYNFKVDWWSLGCVIYDMMSGKPPFTGNSHKVIQEKIIKNKLKLPYYFSMDAKDLLNKLLNKNPEKRIAVDDQWSSFQNHRFFRKINWKELEQQSCAPPLVPVITDPILAENFLEEFTGMKLSVNDEEGLEIGVNDFKGFSYTASESYILRYLN